MPQDEEYERHLSPEEYKQLELRQRSFLQVKNQIKELLSRVEPKIDEQRSEDVVRQLSIQCYSGVLDIIMANLSYSESMAILAKTTQQLSDSKQQPQDLKVDIDFYGQVERLSENFITDVRRQEAIKYQQDESFA